MIDIVSMRIKPIVTRDHANQAAKLKSIKGADFFCPFWIRAIAEELRLSSVRIFRPFPSPNLT